MARRLDNIVNVIGNYSGTVLFDLGRDDHSAAFEIDADGQWTITIKPSLGRADLGSGDDAQGRRRQRLPTSCRRRSGLDDPRH